MVDKRKLKVARYKQQKARDAAAGTRKKFVHDREVKGVRGFELRQETLGQEFVSRTKKSSFVDKRLGDDDEDFARMKKVRQKKAEQYNLSEGTDSLMHQGSALGEPTGGAARAEEEDEDGEPSAKRRKTREEVLDEIIEKSKSFREEKKIAAAERDEELVQLDTDFKEISNLLEFKDKKTSLQQLSIKPLPTADGSAPPAEKKTAGRVLVLGKDGGVKAGTIGGEVKDVDASAVDRLLADVRRTAAKEEVVPAKGGAAATVAAPAEEVGAYDLLMQELQKSAIGKVGHRTKGPAEIAAESQAEFIRLQREKTRRLRGTEDDADSDEEGGGGGDAPHVYQPKYHDGESQEKRDSKARKQASSLFEGYMQQLENECKPGEGGAISIDFERVDTIVLQLKQLCGVSPVAACLTARGLIEVLNDLLEAEAAQTAATAASVSTSPFSLLVPAVLTKIFPPSDFRHPVMTPLSLYLSSALMQTPLRTLRDVSAGLFRAALLIDMSKDTHRYNGEVLSFLTNVLALQGASDAATPAAAAAAAAGNDYYAFLKKEGRSNPLLSECIPELPCADRSMLASDADSDEQQPSKKKRKRGAEASADAAQAPALDFAASFCTADQTVADSPAVRRQLVAAAYRLLVRAVACFGVCEDGTEHLQPALAPVLETLEAVAPALHPALSALDAQLRAALGGALEASVSGRFPLRLQAHRPIPLPLYEPKVTDFEEGEEDERRALKAQFRAEKKAAIRSLRQDAQFLNAAKEKERAYEMGKREDILNSMTAELQGQRKMIKQSDVARSKLRDMQKKAKK